MKDGLFSVVAATGGVAVVLVWSMSAQDPYWRLFETPSVPAPAYDWPEDLRAVLASAAPAYGPPAYGPAYGNADSGAISPAADPLAGARPAGIPLDTITIARAAGTAAIPGPTIARVPPLEPEPTIAYRPPRAAIPASAGFEPATDFVVAFAPLPAPLPVARHDPGAGAVAQAASGRALDPFNFNAPAVPARPRVAASEGPGEAPGQAGRIDVQRRLALAGFEPDTDLVAAFAPVPLPVPLPMALRGPGAGAFAQAASGRALDPFNAPAAPAQPRIAATERTEEALALGQNRRIDVQRRLALAGFDPNGLDGAFGPRTRGAIADFQTAWNFPATGYLEAAVYADLNQRTENAYQALRRQAAAAPSAAPELAPIARERQFASAAEDDVLCARRSDGRIIERQSLACDLAGFGEQFVSLGRNILNDEDGGEDGGAIEIAARTPLVLWSGADR